MTCQPEWKLVYASDCEAVFTDATGVYAPEMEHADELEGEDDSTFYVYRFPLERQKVVGDYLVPYSYDAATYPHPLPQYEEWFADNLDHVASSSGLTRDALVEMLCSDDPRQLAHAYDAIGGHYGFDNFDGYPLTLTAEQFSKRW